MKKTTAFPANNSSFSLSGALSLLAGAGLLLASGSSLQSISAQERVIVDLSSWSYLTQIHFDLNRSNTSAEAELRALQNAEFTFADAKAVSDVSFAPKLAARVPRRAVAAHKKNAVAGFSRSIARPVVDVTTQDRLPAVQAAPIHAPAAVLVVTPETQVEADATQTQLEAFQKMHQDLRLQFLSAVNAVPGVTTQVASQEVQSDGAISHVAAPARIVRPVVKHRVKAVSHKTVRPTLKASKLPPVRAAIVKQPEAPASELASSKLMSPSKIISSSDLVVAPVTELTPTAHAVAAAKPVVMNSAVTVASAQITPSESIDKAYEQISEISKAVFAGMTTEVAPTAPINTGASQQMATQQLTEASRPSEVVQKASTGASVLVGTGGGYSSGKQTDYSSLNLYKMWQAWNGREQAAPVAAPAPKVPGVELAQAGQITDAMDDATHGLVRQTPAVVEAYEWKRAVVGATTTNVTLEGWKRLEAMDHWPALNWNPDGQARTAMISHNAAVLLAKLAEVQLQPDAAIVFGKIPAGWNVEFSDRAEKVIYTDENNRLDVPSDGTRYFTFLNAAPGAQLITLKAILGAETASVAVPVLNGSSTYLDLTSVSKRVFNGYVLDATAQARKGVSGAAVSVIGQPNSVFFATESGYFNLSEVYAIGTYPVYVETSTPQGFKHRYRITPDRMENMELFRMSDAQVQGWVGQLEGGVSPDSGMIVAAMPKLTRKYGDGRLFAGTRSLLPNRTLSPETYIISEDGALDAGKPLEMAASRFISVQVPAGPVVSHVEDNNRNIVWSQLVLAQPGVVNVVGPY